LDKLSLCPAAPASFQRGRWRLLSTTVFWGSIMLTMQKALLALTEYWAERGCMIVQPMNTEVGAGTLNPATALRVLGPEPWRVAYVEPSVRPDDSRYGDNPNRLQTHLPSSVQSIGSSASRAVTHPLRSHLRQKGISTPTSTASLTGRRPRGSFSAQARTRRTSR
jgi:hypothetical protein